MPTGTFCCGAECGITQSGAATSTLKHWDALVGASPSLVSGRGGSGNAYRFTGAAASNYLQRTITGSPTSYVMRHAFRFVGALPDINTSVACFHAPAGGFPSLRFRVATGDVIPALGTTTTGATPFVVVPDVWYVYTAKCDVSSGTRTMTVQIKRDGAATYTDLGTASASTAASTIDQIRLGWAVAGEAATGSMDVDDIMFSATTGDYPLSAGRIVGLRPRADGTHSFNAVGDFQYNGVNNMPSTSPTDTYLYIDDLLDNILDFLAISGAAAGEYLEWLFNSLPDQVAAVNGMELVSAHHAATTSANKQTLRLVDGASTDDIADADFSNITITYNSKHYATAPSGGALTKAKVDAFKLRWTSSFGTVDISPVPYLNAVMFEVDCDLYDLTPHLPPVGRFTQRRFSARPPAGVL